MSLLDDAQRLMVGPATAYWQSVPVGTVGRFGPDMGTVLMCGHCRNQVHAHTPDCPVPSLPKIVAVLKTAERLVSIWQEMADRTAKRNAAPWAELGALPSAADLHDDDYAARRDLIEAVRDTEDRG